MTLPRNDAQALRRYGVKLLPLISYWRERLASTCQASIKLECITQLLRSDILETQVFVGVCQVLEAARESKVPMQRDALSQHVLLIMTDTLCKHGFSTEAQHLVDKLVVG